MSEYPPTDPPPARAETGPMSFGDDWPGVFIRGDDALFYAESLRQHLAEPSYAVFRKVVEGLAELLRQSAHKPGETIYGLQALKPFEETRP